LFIPTIPDPLSAAAGVAATLAALEERRRTGNGQWIDLSQYECASFATLIDILRGGETGMDRPRTGNRHAWRAPQGVYSCAGADAWVTVAVETDEQWARLCDVIGRADLAGEERLAAHSTRHVEHDRIDDAIGAWTRGRTKHEAMHLLQQAGVPAGAVQNAKDLHHDPQVQALEYFRAAWGSELGLRIWPGTWYGMQATPGDVRRGTSTFGEDNERVLRDLLGYDSEKVKALLREPERLKKAFECGRPFLQRSYYGLDVDDLIERYEHAVAAGEHHPVLLSGLFILDLLVIHPF